MTPGIDNAGQGSDPALNVATASEVRGFPRTSIFRTDVPLCLRIGGSTGAIASDILHVVVGRQVDGVLRLTGLFPVPSSEISKGKSSGPFSGFSNFAADIVVDAFTCNTTQCFNAGNYATHRSADFQALNESNFQSVIRLEDPDWLSVTPDGLSMMLRARVSPIDVSPGGFP